MSITPVQSALRLIILLLLSTLLFSCGSSENSARKDNSAGIAFQLDWPVAKSVASAPAGVATVRMSVSAPDMTTMSSDFPASAGTGTIEKVPAGSGRTITFQGLDSDLILKYQKDIPNVKLVAGQTYPCGTVTMAVVGSANPAAPSSLRAAAVSSNQIDLAWANNATDATGYKIERKTGTGAFAKIGAVGANVSTYSDTTVSTSNIYYYRVYATNGFGDSAYSNEANVTYSISGSVKTGGTDALAGVSVTLSGSGSTSTVTSSSGSYSFSGAENGNYTLTPEKTGYTFSPATLPVTVAGGNLSSVNFTASATTLPAAPSGFSATASSSSRINLVWGLNNAINATGYKIGRTTISGGVYTEVASVLADVSAYVDTNLSASTTYYYGVWAYNDKGPSAVIEANATTFAPPVVVTPDLVTVTGGPTGTFKIGRYEVTQREWLGVIGNNPSSFTACGLDCPVETVSYMDVQNFITTLNQRSGMSYRLPTAAEWQYAAQFGGNGALYSGGSDVNAVAWYAGNAANTTHPTGTKQANGLGLFDMSGNVWEFVSEAGVIRGGAWNSDAAAVQTTSSINTGSLTGKNNQVGFRLAITP